MFINWKTKEVSLKIVYYGPSLSGKTTNLEFIHARMAPEMRGDLVSLKTREDRTIFFDFLQIELGHVKGLKPKFNLYTVPGQVYYLASRKLVLQGADGVVFVADSNPQRLADNIEAWNNLLSNLRDLGQSPAAFPTIIQYNKRDLPDAISLDTLRANLGCNGRTQTEAIASKGIGVFETLKPAIRLVMNAVQQRI
jgi:signal recognition particle receptor subunit beta